jgi:hypothetical protein
VPVYVVRRATTLRIVFPTALYVYRFIPISVPIILLLNMLVPVADIRPFMSLQIDF